MGTNGSASPRHWRWQHGCLFFPFPIALTPIVGYSNSLIPDFQLIDRMQYSVLQLLLLDCIEMRIPRGPALGVQPIFKLFRCPVCARENDTVPEETSLAL
jgi:hypothetical protein